MLRRNKIEKCNQEFIITEEGLFHPVCVDLHIFVMKNIDVIDVLQMSSFIPNAKPGVYIWRICL